MDSVQEYNCVFCQETFGNKDDLQTHFRKHGDPNFNQNYHKSRPQVEASSSKSNEQQGEVGCDVCSEVFPTISKAITHKHKVHPDHDTKYFCPWCGKLFTLKHLYSKHLEANHENAERDDHRILHCDCCNVDFYCQAALTSHNKFFHRQEMLPMVGQSKKLKLYDKVVIPIYYCSFCGEEYENKINLHKHINDDHGDENQSPDDVLRCPLCDAIFFHLDAYEVHLTFHSIEDIYTEKNEMFNDVSDFSLESIPPINEKVESYLPQIDAESAIGAVGIERFLELAMDSEGSETPKHKKHKKHKKSKKKAAITLDEFLNMNTDVFGEGLDVQGVEEVPTQVISKRLKIKKPQNVSNAILKPELEKLKKQGIVIKKKTKQNDVPLSTNKSIKISPEAMRSIRPGVQIKKQNDPLSKLISQNQNQLKIVRKSSLKKTDSINENEEMLSEYTPDQSDDNNFLAETLPINNVLEANKTNNRATNDENISSETLGEKPSKTRSPSPDDVVNNESLSEKSTNRLIDDDRDQDERSNKAILPETETMPKHMHSPHINKEIKIADTQDSLSNIEKEQLESDSFNKDLEMESERNTLSTEIGAEQLIDTPSKKDPKESPKGFVNNSLSALKHLSHLLTIKSVNSPESKNIDSETKHLHDSIEILEKNHIEAPVSSIKQQNESILKLHNTDNHKMANTIKNLGKNITIKTVGQTHKNVNNTSTSDDECGEYGEFEKVEEENSVTDKNNTKIDNNTYDTKESAKILKKPELCNDMPKFNKILKEETETGNVSNFDEDSTSQTNKDILKRLSNITAKPLKNTSNQIVPVNKTLQLQSKTKITKHINEDNIEIFNIDDSDSDEIDSYRKMPDKQANPASIHKASSKNLNKNVTVKPVHEQQTVNKSFTKTITKSQTMHSHKKTYHSEESNNKMEYRQATKSVNTKTVAQAATNEKNLAIKNVLKGLGKNITVKSRTSSPSHSIKSQDNDSQDSYIETKDDNSDVESESGNVKITELEENESEDEAKNNDCEQNVIIQSPNRSGNSDNEDFDEQDDIESHIRANKLNKTAQNSQTQISIPSQKEKNINVKSENDKEIDPEEKPTNAIVPFIPKNLGSQISVKSVTQKMDPQNETVKNVRQVNASTSNQMTSNQRISNQTNTVNKAVTVKTFQTETETVIEEITTTVTKTIKTVKQEMRNTSQCSSSVVNPQKVQQIRPNQSMKNYQGTQVKHMPLSGLKIRNPTQVKPVMCGPIRPSNQAIPLGPVRSSTQMVPMRPKANVARLSTPRMPAVKNNLPSTSNRANNSGKPIKISPNAMNSLGTKRANTNNASGHFSCFKKPKESLIPVTDVTSFSGVGQDTVHFTSSQVNKSNFVSTTKTVKGNSVVSQMKSETSASSQQLSKLSNMSGLKVVKTSQAKQSVIQEKSEITAPKRTLEAIEKLQKSGLLVKKSRLDVNEENDYSDHDEDDRPYDSADEADE